MRAISRIPRCSAVLGSLALAVTLAACRTAAPPPVEPAPPPILVEVPAAEWPLLEDDLDLLSLEQACQQSISYLERFKAGREFHFGSETFTAAELLHSVRRVMEIVAAMPDAETRTAALQQELRLMQSSGRDGHGEVLFTGYYEPIIPASKEPAEPFLYPIYAVPKDLLIIDLRDFGLDNPGRPLVGRVDRRRVVPYHDREAIDFEDVLAGKAEILGYLNDIVEVFFLHIQGSGTLELPDGERVRAGYAGRNGQPYRSIGQLLMKEGLMTLDEMSMQGIKRFLEANPDQLRRVLAHNPSYVFFRLLPAEGGPLGCFELPLTAGRSIATDRNLFPSPVVTWVSGTIPTPDGGQGPFARFAVNQDTGGAIRGPGRVDLFFGAGDAAGALAGRTKYLGKLYFLLPKLETDDGLAAASSR